MPFPRFLDPQVFGPQALQRLAVLAAIAAAGPAQAQASKPADPTTGASCSGVMERVDAARATAPERYVKALMSADDRCLGTMERADKAAMITRDEYVKLFKHQPDCSAAAYSYMCP